MAAVAVVGWRKRRIISSISTMGGGAIRAASKFADGIGVGVVHRGLRGATVVLPVEQSVRKPSKPVSAILTSSSSQTVKATNADASVIQRSVWGYERLRVQLQRGRADFVIIMYLGNFLFES
ncbi:hypothetical protein PanWU01x14_276570 [Parasponia andersonii]|uniref:Uncharacterized protein n=1 Tax=Parasponia andersonii TaxID=3476 RepID=A0A2P5B2X1_PARAD|nr:hypothetical protein PanWU01x14_276570 [Parasponia andersonii]